MTKKYLMAGILNSAIAMLNNQGFTAPTFSGSFMLKNQSDSPTSKMVILS